MYNDETGQSWEVWKRFVIENIHRLNDEVDKINEKIDNNVADYYRNMLKREASIYLGYNYEMEDIEKCVESLKELIGKLTKERSIDNKIEIISVCGEYLDFIDNELNLILYDALEEEDE